jgi:hypothetical protein
LENEFVNFKAGHYRGFDHLALSLAGVVHDKEKPDSKRRLPVAQRQRTQHDPYESGNWSNRMTKKVNSNKEG